MFNLMNEQVLIAKSENNFIYDESNKWWSDLTQPPVYYCDTDKIYNVTQTTPPPANGAPNVVS